MEHRRNIHVRVSPGLTSRIDSFSSNPNKDHKDHDAQTRCTFSLAALKAEWAASGKIERVIHVILMLGALFLVLLGVYPSILTSSRSTSGHDTIAIVNKNTISKRSTDANVFDARRFSLPDSHVGILTSQPQYEIHTKATESLPHCVFPKLDISEVPEQHRQEYKRVQDFKAKPQGTVTLYDVTPSSGSACVNNPLLQRLTSRGSNTPMITLFDPKLILTADPRPSVKTVRLPECGSKMSKTGTIAQLKKDPLWVISMKTARTTLSELSFSKAGFKPVLTSAVNGREVLKDCQVGELPVGALGIRLSFRKLILRALHEGHERVIIVEDDVVLQDNFAEKLDHRLRKERCGGFMFDDSTGGVLLLGASEYGGVGLIKAGLNFRREHCYNVNGLTYGAYASVFHRNVFLPILAWLDAPKFANLPFDHIWSHLALRGFIVRVLKPMAALADIIHSSSTSVFARTPVDKLDTAILLWRACLMHWDLQEFEHYRTLLESRQLFDFNRRFFCFRTKDSQSNYRKTHNAVVLIHANPDLASLSMLADMLVARWQAKLDGRFEGFIARPFIVIKAPLGMPAMDTKEILSVVLGMRTQSFNAHQQRVEQALEYASSSSSSSSEKDTTNSVAAVVRKLVLEAQAPVLVLDAAQLWALKRTLFKQPIAQMYIELRAETPWVPTDVQMIELLETTKPRGRHWYMLDIDPSIFTGADDNDSVAEVGIKFPRSERKKVPQPELNLSWPDVQQTASDALKVVHKYSAIVSRIALQIRGLPEGDFTSYKVDVQGFKEEVDAYVITAELLHKKVQAKVETLEQSSTFARDIEQHVKLIFKVSKAVDQLKKNVHKAGVYLSPSSPTEDEDEDSK